MFVKFLFPSSLSMAVHAFHTPYTIQVRKQYHDRLEVIIAGELDETNADEAFAELNTSLEKKNDYVRIDCDFSKLSYTNSTTLAYLTEFIARAHRKGKTITFQKVHPKTQYIFDMIGLSKVVDHPA
jgi:anti-anti-sigma factor